MAKKKGAGGFAAIHAARARKYKAALEEIEKELAKAGFATDPDLPIDQRLPSAIAPLAAEVKELRQKVEDAEWEAQELRERADA